MILTSRHDKIIFVYECFLHIRRIFLTYLNNAEREDASPHLNYNVPYLILSQKSIVGNLPQSIYLNGWLSNVKMGKLYLLVSIYNEAVKSMQTEESINLKDLFSKIKSEQDFELDIRIQTDSNQLMRTHRSQIFRRGPFSFLSRLFPPKSEAFLRKYGFFETQQILPLIQAVTSLQVDKVRSLVSTSTVNQKDNYGYGETPLSMAAYKGDPIITQILIDHGAHVNSDALNCAVEAGNINIVRILFENGADVNEPDSSETTPLRQAFHYVSYPPEQSRLGYDYSVRIDIIKEMLKKPIEWDRHTRDGETIYQYAESKRAMRYNKNNKEELASICKTIKSACAKESGSQISHNTST